MEIWLIDPQSRERLYRLTRREVLALRAYKKRRADAVQEALCLPLIDRAHRDKLWFECGCRRVGSLCPDFYPRRQQNGSYALPNRHAAPVTHDPDCPFRRGDTDGPPRAHHPDVLGGFDAAEEELPPSDLYTRPYAYWKPRPRAAAEQEKTLWGTASKLMQRAGLNLLGAEERRPPPGEWLAAIVEAAGSLYLPPRVPASGYLFTDPATWRSGEVAARLEAAAADWPEGGRPRGYLCWPVGEVSGHAVDPGGEGHVEAPHPVVCPSVGGRPVIGPYLFLGAVARSADGWTCINACARPIAALDCPVPVDSDYERQATGALWRLVRTLAGNRELAALLGGAPRVELEKPLALIKTRAGTCLPDFVLTVFRPGAYIHLPGGPGDPRHFGRFDPRDRAEYVIEVMGFHDRKYEESKKRTHPRMEHLGQLKTLEGRKFGSKGQRHRPPARGVDGRDRPRPAPALAEGGRRLRRRVSARSGIGPCW